MVILEHDHDIDLELDLERLRRDRRAREQPREDHVEPDGDAPRDVALGHLDVLDLRRLLRVALRAPAGLHAHELDLDGLDGRLALLDGDEPCERGADVAAGAVDLAVELERGQGLGARLLPGAVDLLGVDGEGDDDALLGVAGVVVLGLHLDDELESLGKILRHEVALQFDAEKIADVDKYAVVGLVELLPLRWLQAELEGDLGNTVGTINVN